MSIENHVSAIERDIAEAEELANAYSSPDSDSRRLARKIEKLGRHRRKYEMFLDDTLFYAHREHPEIQQLFEIYERVVTQLTARLAMG